MNSAYIWIALLSLAASTFFSTLSYALRMMSRVDLEDALAAHRRENVLNLILAARHDLSLTASILRLFLNSLLVFSLALFSLSYVTGIIQKTGDTHPYLLQALGLTFLIAIPALLLFSVAIPQALAKYAGEFIIARTWPLLRFVHWLFFPLLAVMKIIDEIIRRLSGVTDRDRAASEAQHTDEEILAVVSEGTAEGTVDEEQKKMIEGVISFRDLQVGQIMTPRTDIIALDVSTPLPEIRDKILKDGLSRLPVYEGNLDNILGILYAKDLLSNLGQSQVAPFELRKFLRPPLFVPPTKPLRDLLREFRIQQVHIALVLDEYGGTSGLVTTEDILEEIVGNIADEYERPEPAELKFLAENIVEVDARMNLSDLNHTLELNLPEDQDYHTLGGFVINTLGIIPNKGETLAHDGLTITVLDSEPRRVKRLRLDLPQKHPPQTEESPTTSH